MTQKSVGLTVAMAAELAWTEQDPGECADTFLGQHRMLRYKVKRLCELARRCGIDGTLELYGFPIEPEEFRMSLIDYAEHSRAVFVTMLRKLECLIDTKIYQFRTGKQR